MQTLGIHHLGLSVADLDATVDFFVNCLGWSVVKEVPAYPAKFVTNGEAFFTLWQTNAGARAADRRNNVGLHHVAIRVASDADLLAIYTRAAGYAGVTVEFAPEPLGGGPARHCMLYEPSGIRLELIWAP
jgi:catechol 2,3-dioxygenase-like lactoylglutathione lyase family enzyme